MIPKIIHYCWFGDNPLPELAQKCIDSWKKYCPDYEIKEWNESNFDVSCCDYVKEAYQAKKWAFVSDYARFLILYREGGLYFDTDVEIIKPLDDIVDKGAFMGCETMFDFVMGVNPGLVMGGPACLDLYKELLDSYAVRHFFKENGELDTTTIVEYTSDIMKKRGWNNMDRNIQMVAGVVIYPPEYFCPMDYETGKIVITDNTYTIHHYTASWHNKSEARILEINRFCANYFGKTHGKKIARVLDFPYRVKKKIERLGFKGTLRFAKDKIKGY